MEIHEALDKISSSIKHNDWFYDISIDGPNKIIVYTKWQSGDIIKQIPEFIDNIQVLVHFVPRTISWAPKTPTIIVAQSNTDSDEGPEYNINDLIKELDRIEKLCGSHTLQDIFYEIHDGKNAVTNLSARYPEVRRDLELLYDRYGFDVIYEEIDG